MPFVRSLATEMLKGTFKFLYLN